jgi:hypothetical protein
MIKLMCIAKMSIIRRATCTQLACVHIPCFRCCGNFVICFCRQRWHVTYYDTYRNVCVGNNWLTSYNNVGGILFILTTRNNDQFEIIDNACKNQMVSLHGDTYWDIFTFNRHIYIDVIRSVNDNGYVTVTHLSYILKHMRFTMYVINQAKHKTCT